MNKRPIQTSKPINQFEKLALTELLKEYPVMNIGQA
jgi:hypothetical protein